MAWRLRIPNYFEKYRCPAKIQNGGQNGGHFGKTTYHSLLSQTSLHLLFFFLVFGANVHVKEPIESKFLLLFHNGGQNGGHFQNDRHRRLKLQFFTLQFTALTDFDVFGV